MTLDPEQQKFELRGFTHTQMFFNNNYCGATRLWLVESVAAEEPRILRADAVRLGLTLTLLMASCRGRFRCVLAPVPGTMQ